tara:strand:- start:674 stop:841 length:168 start_codon:yes stop_codon:yes gene_type:complete
MENNIFLGAFIVFLLFCGKACLDPQIQYWKLRSDLKRCFEQSELPKSICEKLYDK